MDPESRQIPRQTVGKESWIAMGASKDEPECTRAKGTCGFFKPPTASRTCGLWEELRPLSRSYTHAAQGLGKLKENVPWDLKHLEAWGLPVPKRPWCPAPHIRLGSTAGSAASPHLGASLTLTSPEGHSRMRGKLTAHSQHSRQILAQRHRWVFRYRGWEFTLI